MTLLPTTVKKMARTVRSYIGDMADHGSSQNPDLVGIQSHWTRTARLPILTNLMMSNL